jgi:hypothetical protein
MLNLVVTEVYAWFCRSHRSSVMLRCVTRKVIYLEVSKELMLKYAQHTETSDSNIVLKFCVTFHIYHFPTH